eukprot:6202455-Pleurochrysis_carterae.AAC.3
MHSDLPANEPAYGFGLPWKVTWNFQKIVEMPVIMRDASQTNFIGPESVPVFSNCDQSKYDVYVFMTRLSAERDR